MFTYFSRNSNYHKMHVTCRGELFEQNTPINYDDNNPHAEGEIWIAYYDNYGMIESTTKEQNENAIFVNVRIFIKQNCIHDSKNKQYIITGCDFCDGQYKMEHVKITDKLNIVPPIYLNDIERKKYDGTINVTTHTQLTNIIGNEPSSKCIIDTVNYALLNDFPGKNQNVAIVIHKILNGKNSQLHSFIHNK